MRSLALLALLLVLPACCTLARSRDDRISGVLAALDRVNTHLDPDDDYAAYRSRVWSEVREEARRLEEPAQLYALAIACQDRLDHRPPTDQDRLAETDADWEAIQAVLSALGDLKCEESARLLVRLLEDHRFPRDGESALNIAHAIITCGEIAVPHLKRVRDPCQRDFSARIQQWIKEDRDVP